MLIERKSGLLLPVFSLPSRFGIGDLGPAAYSFVDFLVEAKQRVWQLLPLGPTSPPYGNSPYSGTSAFAGNPLLISIELLRGEGLLDRSDFKNVPLFPDGRVDYACVTAHRRRLLSRLAEKPPSGGREETLFTVFCEKNAFWLDDFALFEALKERTGGSPWHLWPSQIRDRRRKAIDRELEGMSRRIRAVKYLQYLFFRQWKTLQDHCRRRSIQLVGDLPLYVNYESADVWAHPEVFNLSRDKKPITVSGVPPDYFSRTGQLWNNPIYRWDYLKSTGYGWWVERIRHNLGLFDHLRIDHFRGFAGFWEVPAAAKTAQAGKWVPGPGEDFFKALLGHFSSLSFIAEDLGEITPDVRELRDRFALPGMRVLQFAFGEEGGSDYHKPHSYVPNCVAYSGTHDNSTLVGWLTGRGGRQSAVKEGLSEEGRSALRYLGRRGGAAGTLSWELIRLLMLSPARLVIFPLQDILGFGDEARMNRPGVARGNWEWRVSAKQMNGPPARRLAEMVEQYGRQL